MGVRNDRCTHAAVAQSSVPHGCVYRMLHPRADGAFMHFGPAYMWYVKLSHASFPSCAARAFQPRGVVGSCARRTVFCSSINLLLPCLFSPASPWPVFAPGHRWPPTALGTSHCAHIGRLFRLCQATLLVLLQLQPTAAFRQVASTSTRSAAAQEDHGLRLASVVALQNPVFSPCITKAIWSLAPYLWI
jgi:hypothetical protein